jgi:poly-gamma-glutamate capsule biosynthesis protein CapA/YwtB (metallophosphatase superfamily)
MIEALSSSYRPNPRKDPRRVAARRPPPRRRAPKARPPLVPIVLVALVVIGVFAFTRCDSNGELPPPLKEAVEKAQKVKEKQEKAALRSFTIAATGDFLTHEALLASALEYGDGQYEFGPMLDPIKEIISAADFAVCHQEIPMTATNENITAYPVFRAPRQMAKAIADTGYDACSTASNHSLDGGSEGIADTLKLFERQGLRTEGTNRTPNEDGKATLVPINDVVVGWLSYTYGLNGLVGEDHEVNVIDTREILQRAQDAKKRGAEFVFVSLHWGIEFQSTPSEEQMTQARRLLRSPAVDLIIGHHVHVPQPIMKVGKEYVLFGLGNILSNQRAGVTADCCPTETQDGLIAQIEVNEKANGTFKTTVRYTPTWVEPGTYRVLPVAQFIDDPETAAETRAALMESWRRTLSIVNSLGANRAGVRPTERPSAA